MKLIIGTVLLFSANICLAQQVAVIAHPSVKSDSLDKDSLYEIYKGEVRSWEDGTKIKVWDLGEKGKVRDLFYDFLGKRPSRMKSIWMRQLLTGEGEPPDEVDSEDDMIEKISATPGSIGYINKDKVDSRVKLLLVIEKEEKD